MADHADDSDGDIFVYRGGGRAPRRVTHVLIDKSVDEIEEKAFMLCESLVKVDTHDGIRRVWNNAFWYCRSLRKINLKSIIRIGQLAFFGCENLTDAEFGDELETIRGSAFTYCTSLKHLKLSSVIIIGSYAFMTCRRLLDIEFPTQLETIRKSAFSGCERLRRIVIPLKRNLFSFDDSLQRYNQFDECDKLVTVDLVGGIHKTVASLHMESWRTDMLAEINRINEILPSTPADENTDVIRQWMELTLDKMDHYKAEHNRCVREGITVLELGLWKAKLDEEDEDAERRTQRAEIDAESGRKEKRITCGVDIVIKNVLPFLQMI